jgi:hypothetical protein
MELIAIVIEIANVMAKLKTEESVAFLLWPVLL